MYLQKKDQPPELVSMLRDKRAFRIMKCKECGNEFSAKRIGDTETFAFDMAQIQTPHCCTIENLTFERDNFTEKVKNDSS